MPILKQNISSPLDAVDLHILDRLQRDARIANVDLAKQVHLSPSPCLSRVRRLEQSGIVKQYVALLDPRRLGLTVSVFIQVSLEKQIESALEVFENSIGGRPEVMECYLMTGTRDYLLRVVMAELASYEQFLKHKLTRLECVGSIEPGADTQVGGSDQYGVHRRVGGRHAHRQETCQDRERARNREPPRWPSSCEAHSHAAPSSATSCTRTPQRRPR